MESFLHVMLPRVLPEGPTFEIHAFQGKHDLLRRVEPRLRAYSKWLPDGWRLVVMVDRDGDDCRKLKARLEQAAQRAGLRSRSAAREEGNWQLVNRIVIEELEAWYFGDWQAVRAAYPRVSETVPRQSRYRDPDAIAAGTWEAFERILKRRGYFAGGLRKTEAARAVAAHFDPSRSRSRSFIRFWEAITECAA